MKWMKFRIRTVVDAEDIIISELYDRGLEGAQIEDKVPLTALEKEQMFVDIPPESEEDDGTAYLSFFVEEQENDMLVINGEETDRQSVLDSIEEALTEVRQFMEIGEGTVTVTETEDIDWINNWKQYFHQFTIDDLLVIPSWEEVKEEDRKKKILHIDPGTAFGTGMHETTQLCIRQIWKYLTPQAEILDVGTGSGILAILALMYGAGHALGTDLDPCAADAVAQNKEANGIPEDAFDLLIGNIITEKDVQDRVGYEKYDIVTANILADVLVPLTPIIASCLKKGGVYITSGIIEGKEELVTTACGAAGLTVLEVTAQGEWRSVTAQKL
ncbi:MAG: 50S ribosomal protein L11 methyltransferase [Bacteroidales bacterium]|nr:50S ribosomal protein L11 methyltransferase [Bacteroidales bacterium]MCM1414779.1 50S ribosomal protein L11 methyltransferase [bacterium]MCM1423215.1 50S ribosomal protein L11 methyltransferase [bacterium]